MWGHPNRVVMNRAAVPVKFPRQSDHSQLPGEISANPSASEQETRIVGAYSTSTDVGVPNAALNCSSRSATSGRSPAPERNTSTSLPLTSTR